MNEKLFEVIRFLNAMGYGNEMWGFNEGGNTCNLYPTEIGLKLERHLYVWVKITHDASEFNFFLQRQDHFLTIYEDDIIKEVIFIYNI